MPPNAPHLTTTATGTSTTTAAKCPTTVASQPHVRNTAVRNHFHRHYAELCRRRNRQPLSELREHSKSVLDFHCDRVRLDDWPLILEALAADDGLVGLGVLARKSCLHVLESVDSEKKCRALRSQPPFCAQFIFAPLIECIAKRLAAANTGTLVALQLEGLPLTLRYVQHISRALQQNRSVRFLSVARSNVGDDGCELLCTTLKHLPHVDRIDFSACFLTTAGAASIGALLRYQKIVRFSEGWRQSLRYRDVHADQIPGLKYLALNRNATVGDDGLRELLAVLTEDEWIRGVEMQQCGITERGAEEIVQCLQVNRTLLVFDVRNNAGVEVQTMNRMRRLMGIEVEEETPDSGGMAVPAQAVTGVKPVSIKAKMAQSKERISSLEQQLAIEVEQRQQAEALNAQLHQQIVEARRQLSEKQPAASAASATNVTPDFTLVSKEHLHSLLQEVCEQHAGDLNARSSTMLSSPMHQSHKGQGAETATSTWSSGGRSSTMRKMISENMALPTDDNQLAANASNSVGRDRDRRMITFADRQNGDTGLEHAAGQTIGQPIKRQSRRSRRRTHNVARTPQTMVAPSSFFSSPSAESDADSDNEHIDVDPFAHGDC